MSDFRGRLMMEHGELHQRLEKLKAFILSDQFDQLSDIDRADLREQQRHMSAYLDVLHRRVSRLCVNA